MKFSIFMMPLDYPTENPSLGFDRDISLIQYADELGYDEFFIVAHAIEHGLEIWSGLHTFIADVPELAALAASHGVAIRDLRRPPASLDVSRGRVRSIDATIVLTVGTDCNIGKMTTQLQILDALRDRGIRTAFAATGQTGILIEGRGIAVDAVVADFIAGAASVSSSRTRRTPTSCSSKDRAPSSTRATRASPTV